MAEHDELVNRIMAQIEQTKLYCHTDSLVPVLKKNNTERRLSTDIDVMGLWFNNHYQVNGVIAEIKTGKKGPLKERNETLHSDCKIKKQLFKGYFSLKNFLEKHGFEIGELKTFLIYESKTESRGHYSLLVPQKEINELQEDYNPHFFQLYSDYQKSLEGKLRYHMENKSHLIHSRVNLSCPLFSQDQLKVVH